MECSAEGHSLCRKSYNVSHSSYILSMRKRFTAVVSCHPHPISVWIVFLLSHPFVPPCLAPGPQFLFMLCWSFSDQVSSHPRDFSATLFCSRSQVIVGLPHLQSLDGLQIEGAEREQADQLVSMHTAHAAFSRLPAAASTGA